MQRMLHSRKLLSDFLGQIIWTFLQSNLHIGLVAQSITHLDVYHHGIGGPANPGKAALSPAMSNRGISSVFFGTFVYLSCAGFFFSAARVKFAVSSTISSFEGRERRAHQTSCL